MRRFLGAAAVALLCVAASPPAPAAVLDLRTNTNFRSNITAVDPQVPGLSLQILDYNDELVLTNHSGRTVTVLGYSAEPFARILADGTVELNIASPAVYLNRSFYANVSVPPSANARFPPHWITVAKTATYQWHDHRIHWMSPVTPPQVNDKSRTTKIFDWLVPIRVGTRSGAVHGTLFWVGHKGGVPSWAIVSLILIAAAGLMIARRSQRRRIARGRDANVADGDQEAPREAW